MYLKSQNYITILLYYEICCYRCNNSTLIINIVNTLIFRSLSLSLFIKKIGIFNFFLNFIKIALTKIKKSELIFSKKKKQTKYVKLKQNVTFKKQEQKIFILIYRIVISWS